MTLPFLLNVLHDDVAADFAERENPAKLFLGEWEEARLIDGPKVCFSLGAGDPVDIGGAGGAQHYAMGYDWPTGDGTVARALAGLAMRVVITCSAPAPDGLDPDARPMAARAATWELFRATFAALWHSHGGPFPWGGWTPLNEGSGLRTYGGAVRFWAAFVMPIVDDDDEVITAEDGRGVTTLEREPDEVITEAPNWMASPADLAADT
jgi:hypothetical protein